MNKSKIVRNGATIEVKRTKISSTASSIWNSIRRRKRGNFVSRTIKAVSIIAYGASFFRHNRPYASSGAPKGHNQHEKR